MDKEGDNHTRLEILFKGRYQSIFSKKGDSLPAAKMTNSLKQMEAFKFYIG